jgi:hypothetical protein
VNDSPSREANLLTNLRKNKHIEASLLLPGKMHSAIQAEAGKIRTTIYLGMRLIVLLQHHMGRSE